MTDHLGYDRAGAGNGNGNGNGNARNGSRSKSVLTDIGPVEISVPRDRGSSFEP